MLTRLNEFIMNCVILRQWLVFFFLLQFHGNVMSLAIFETWILSFNNSRNMIATRDCCGSGTSAAVGCPSQCGTYFEVCLDDVHLTEPNCRFGEALSSNFERSNLNFDATSLDRKLLIASHSAWPGEFGIRITVRDNSSSHLTPQGNIIQTFSVVGSKKPSSSWHMLNATGPVSFLQFRYRIKCGTYYYGVNCTSYCKERHDEHGHYRCDSVGRRICLDGWIDPITYCRTAICNPACTNGLCISPNVCRCHSGWTGDVCSVCITRAGCQNGTCSTPGDCVCDSGWGGINCDTELDYCGMRAPCLNSGTCINRPAPRKFLCFCSSEFTGRKCETRITACTSNPCKNGASCQVTSTGFTCSCTAEYTGHRCEIFVDLCSTVVCKNNGTCSVISGSATCQCISPYTGEHCEEILLKPSYTIEVLGSTLVKSYAGISVSSMKTNTEKTSQIGGLPSIEFLLTSSTSEPTKFAVHSTGRQRSSAFSLSPVIGYSSNAMLTSESRIRNTGSTLQTREETITRLQTQLHDSILSSTPSLASMPRTTCCNNGMSNTKISTVKSPGQSEVETHVHTQDIVPSPVTDVYYISASSSNVQNNNSSSGNIGKKMKREPSDKSLAIAISASLSIVAMICLALTLLWRKTLKERNRRLRISSIIPSSVSFPRELLDPGNFKYTTFIDSKSDKINDDHNKQINTESSSNKIAFIHNRKVTAICEGLPEGKITNHKSGNEDSSPNKKTRTGITRCNTILSNTKHRHEADSTRTESRNQSVSTLTESQCEVACIEFENRRRTTSSDGRKDSNANFDGLVNYGYLSEGTSGYSSNCSSARSSVNYQQKFPKSFANISNHDVSVLSLHHAENEAIQDLPNCIVYKEEQL